MNYAKKLLALILLFCMVLNLVPAAFAENDGETPPPNEAVTEDGEEPTPEEPAPEEPIPEVPPDETPPPDEIVPEEPTEQPPEETEEAPPTEEESPTEETTEEETPAPDEETNPEETDPTEPLPEQPEEAEELTTGEITQGEIIQIITDRFPEIFEPLAEVIDKPWDIRRDVTIEADSSFGNGVRAVTYTLLVQNGVTKVCYCIEPGKPITDAGVNTGFTSTEQAEAWNNLSPAKQKAIHLTLGYGYPTRTFNDISTSDASQKYAATQLIIWEIILGARDPITFVCSDMYCNHFNQSRYPVLYDVYNKISRDLVLHNHYPTFATPVISKISNYTYDLNYDKASGKYVCTLVDTTPADYRTLPEYDFVPEPAVRGLTITRVNDYTLRIECTKAAANNLPANLKFKAEGNAVEPNASSTIIVWEAKGTTDQKLVSSDCVDDPVPVYFSIRANIQGAMTGRKTTTAPNGDVEGFCFKFYSWETKEVWYAKTDASGKLHLTDSNYSTLGSTQITGLPEGNYTLREMLSLKGAGLVYPDKWEITVTDANGKSETTTYTSDSPEMMRDNGDFFLYKIPINGLSGGGSITMTINNVPNTLEIYKTSPDGNVEGITFHVKDANGIEVGSDTTDKTGKIEIEGLVIGQTYTVHEDVPDGYICALSGWY